MRELSDATYASVLPCRTHRGFRTHSDRCRMQGSVRYCTFPGTPYKHSMYICCPTAAMLCHCRRISPCRGISRIEERCHGWPLTIHLSFRIFAALIYSFHCLYNIPCLSRVQPARQFVPSPYLISLCGPSSTVYPGSLTVSPRQSQSSISIVNRSLSSQHHISISVWPA